MVETVAVKVSFNLDKSLPTMGRLLAVRLAMGCPLTAAEWLNSVCEAQELSCIEVGENKLGGFRFEVNS